MTDEQIRIAVAKACGWEQITQKTVDGGGVLFSELHGIKPPLRGWMLIPNYPADLNACHEMEKSLTDFEHRTFRAMLFCEAYNSGECKSNDEAERVRVSATARQRCEAFLKVKGLWK